MDGKYGRFGRYWDVSGGGDVRGMPTWTRSGDEGDAPVGVEQCGGGGPAVEDAHDASSGAVHEPGGGVPQPPAQRLGFGDGERRRSGRAAGTSAPGRRRSRPRRARRGWRRCRRRGSGWRRSPSVGGCGLRRGRGRACARPASTGSPVGVGVVTPVAEHRRREQGLLGAGVQRLAAHDQPGPVAASRDRSTRSVSSATAAPGRSSPSWRQRRLPGVARRRRSG